MLRPCLRNHDQRRRSSTTCIGGITPDQLQQLRGRSPSSAAVSNLTNTGKLSHLPARRRSTIKEPITTSLPTRQTLLHGDQLLLWGSVTCGSQDNLNRRLKVSVDCDVTNRHPSKETIKILQDDKSTRRLSRESSDGNKRFESPRRTSSAKQSLPDHGLQMKIIITLLIILTIVVTVMMLSYWIRRVT